nr:zinc finger, CCHC-type, retrotransposon Gag domain protein [Tanacetum cinerariifolium]
MLFRCTMFIYSFYLCYSLSLYTFIERYAQSYFFSCLIRQMVNIRTDADLSAAVQNALQTLLPQIHVEIREEFRTSSGPSDAGGNPPQVTVHTWLERFNKQKPHSFEKATVPVDAENWISHMEKIFDVMGCKDAFETRLVVYKFEGNALAWWKAYKQAKGGDRSGDRRQPTSQQSSHRNHGHNNDRPGSDRRRGGDNHRRIPAMDVTKETGVISLTDLPILFDDKIRAINAYPLDMCEFDLILGMDWLTERHATIDCHAYRPTSQQSSHRSHGHHNNRHGSDRRGGSDNHRSSGSNNNNYSSSNNRNSGNRRDQRNRGHQSNRSANSGNSS